MLCAKSRFGHLLILFCKPCPPNLHVFALCVICTGGGLLTPFMMHVAITLWLSYIYVHVATAHQWNEHSLDQLEGIAVATIELSCWLGCALASKSSSSMASCCTGNIIECLLYNARLHWKWWVWNKVHVWYYLKFACVILRLLHSAQIQGLCNIIHMFLNHYTAHNIHVHSVPPSPLSVLYNSLSVSFILSLSPSLLPSPSPLSLCVPSPTLHTHTTLACALEGDKTFMLFSIHEYIMQQTEGVYKMLYKSIVVYRKAINEKI